MEDSKNKKLIKEFHRRKLQMLRCYAFSMTLVVVALVLLQFSNDLSNFFKIETQNWHAAAISQFIAAIVFLLVGFRQYRCPYCNELLRGADRNYLGVLISPDRCPHCGKKLSF